MDKELQKIAESIGLDAPIEEPEPTDTYFAEEDALEELQRRYGEKRGREIFESMQGERRKTDS